MKDLLDYLGSVFLVFVGLYLIVSIISAVMPDTTPSYSYSSSKYNSSSYSSSSYSAGSSSSYTKKATPTPKAASKSSTSSKKSSSSSSKKSTSSYRDPDDYMDVEGYYYDNRSDFESEDDAWDYLDDDWDDWD